MEIEEVLNHIENLINEQKLPQEVKQMVNEIYLDYDYTYKRCLSMIEDRIESNRNLMKELSNIAIYLRDDYEKNQYVSNEIGETSYMVKKDNMKEEILNAINNLSKIKTKENNQNDLPPIIDVEEVPQKETRENQIIEQYVRDDKSNREVAEQIKESVLSEIDSSKRVLLIKISTILEQKKDEYLENVKTSFEKEVELIKNKAKLKLSPEIREALNAQDGEICKEVLDVFNQYRDEKANNMSDREKFISSVHVETNPEEAVKKALEEVKKDDETKDLPGNVIE